MTSQFKKEKKNKNNKHKEHFTPTQKNIINILPMFHSIKHKSIQHGITGKKRKGNKAADQNILQN